MNVATFLLGPLELSIGVLCIALGVIAASLVLVKTTRDEGVSLRFLDRHLFLFVLIPLFLGRFGAYIKQYDLLVFHAPGDVISAFFYHIWSFLMIGDGGIAIEYGLTGLFLTFLVIAFWHDQPHMQWLDAFALPATVLMFFAMLGAYFAGWMYGAPAPESMSWPLTVQYDMLTVRYSVPVYATQLYLAAFFFIMFVIGWVLWQRKLWQRWSAGRFFAVLVLLSGLVGGLVGFLRGDIGITTFVNADWWLIFKPLQYLMILVVDVLGLSIPQAVSFAAMLVAALFLIFRHKIALPTTTSSSPSSS